MAGLINISIGITITTHTIKSMNIVLIAEKIIMI
jgi:hypothetical protein